MGKLFFSSPTSLVFVLLVALHLSSAHGHHDYHEGTPHHGRAKLRERFFWKILDWAYPSPASKSFAISSGEYVPENGVPVGIEVWRNKLFVTVPRLKHGIPATLNYIPLEHDHRHSPKLIPYPNWHQNFPGDCRNSLHSVNRIQADKCNRLWVLDSGVIKIGNTTVDVCPPSLKIFDLTCDRIIRHYELPKRDLEMNTSITNLVVDVENHGCGEAFAYMADELGHGLIIYSWRAHASWRIAHSYFQPDPLATSFNIAGVDYRRSKSGIFGMALSPATENGHKILFFHPTSSNREFAVSTKVLKNKKSSMNVFHEFEALAERHRGHSTSEVMDEHGIMLFNLVDQNAIGCWSVSLPYEPANHAIIAQHDEALVYPDDIKIHRGQLWVISNRMPIFEASQLNYEDVNFRIFTMPLKHAVAGTVCGRRH